MVKELIFDKYQDEAVRPQVMAPSQVQGDVGILPFFPNAAVGPSPEIKSRATTVWPKLYAKVFVRHLQPT